MGNQEVTMREMDYKRKREEAVEDMVRKDLEKLQERRKKDQEWKQQMVEDLERWEREREIAKDSETKRKEQLSRVSSVLEGYKARMKSSEEELKELKERAKSYMGELKGAEVEHRSVVKSIEEYGRHEFLEEKREELRRAREDFDESYKEVQKLVEKTGVRGGSIKKFLELVLGIIPTVLQGEQRSEKMQESFEAFYKMIEDSFTDDISVEDYFAKVRLSKLAPILAENDIESMEDLVCENEEEYEEEILSLLKSQKMSRKQKIKLKKVCLEPKEWRKYQQERAKLNQDLLIENSPLMAEFFGHIYTVAHTASRLMEIGNGLNLEQQKALQEKTVKSIPAPGDFRECEESKDDSSESADYSAGVMLQMEKTHLEEDMRLQDISERNQELSVIAVRSISVVESMRDRFEDAQEAEIFAMSIQSACIEMMHAQGSLRSKVGLIMKLSTFKPVEVSGDAKNLWDLIARSSLQIFQSAIEASRASFRYFTFFLRFKRSFVRYVKAVKNSNCSPYVASESLRRDLRDFLAFRQEYEGKAKELKENAMECIRGCVSGIPGVEGGIQQLKESEKKYLEALRRMQAEKEKVPPEYAKLKNKERETAVKVEKNRRLYKMTVEDIEQIERKQSDLASRIKSFEKILTE